MLLGEHMILPQERLELASGSTAACGEVIWVTLPAAYIVPHRVAMCAILGRCRELRRASQPQSTTMGMSLDTRKVHGVCALFCGLKQAECRISGCFPVDTPVERSVLTTWGLWLELRRARREIAPL